MRVQVCRWILVVFLLSGLRSWLHAEETEADRLRQEVRTLSAEVLAVRALIVELRNEVQHLRNELATVKQNAATQGTPPADQTPPGCFLASVSTDGAGLVMRDGCRYLVAEANRSISKQWRGGNILSFTLQTDISTKDRQVYKIENRTFMDSARQKVEVLAVYAGQDQR